MPRPYRFVGPKNDEIAYINKETRRLEQAIRSLHEERSELLQRLNVLNSPVTSLPFETLSTIFEFACPPHDFHSQVKPPTRDRHNLSKEPDNADSTKEHGHSQLVIGAVSSQWRTVAQASPWLWTSIGLDISPTNAEQRAAFLQLCLANSRWTPIFLSLHYADDFESSAPWLIHESVDSVIIESLPRVRGLHLVKPPRKWLSHTPSLTQIVDCTIHYSDPQSMSVVLPNVAPLRRFSIQLSQIHSMTTVQLPWSGITSLVLSQVRFERAVQMLLKCPNLVEFRCRKPEPPLSSSTVTLTEPVIFQYLEVLELSSSGSWGWSHALIEQLHVPALKQLEWTAYGHTPVIIRAFVHRLPSSLSKVQLHGSSALSHFPLTSNVEHLTVHGCDEEDLKAFLKNLQKLVSRGRGRRRLMSFSQLKTLSLEGHVVRQFRTGGFIYSSSLSPAYSDLFLEVLEKRSTSGISFRLEMENSLIHWQPDVKRRLKALVDSGFDLRIIEESEEVSWLRQTS